MSVTAPDLRTQLLSAIAVLLVGSAYIGLSLVPVGPTSTSEVPFTIVCGFVLAVAIVSVAARLELGARTQFVVWFCLLFLNLAAVAVEGTLFAPAAAPPSRLAVTLLRLLLCSALIAGLAAALFASGGHTDQTIRSRPLHSWLWRLVAAATVYVSLYLVLGGINYTLITHPYYEAHSAGLTVPPVEAILLYEPLRGLLIALSVLPLILNLRCATSLAGVVAGAMLFFVGGVVPLLPQTSLPLYLRVASLWEIFGQNFLTGLACAYLFIGRGQAVDGRLVRRPPMRLGRS